MADLDIFIQARRVHLETAAVALDVLAGTFRGGAPDLRKYFFQVLAFLCGVGTHHRRDLSHGIVFVREFRLFSRGAVLVVVGGVLSLRVFVAFVVGAVYDDQILRGRLY